MRISRGLGDLQRRICEALDAADGREPSLRELRRRLGDPDRSNLRRAIRGLLEREIVEEFESGGERRVKLAYWASLSAGAGPDDHHGSGVEDRFRRGKSVKGTRWFAPGHRHVPIRSLGRGQRRILAVLRERSDPLDEGLPVTVVRAMAGGDRANTRRAIRTLLLYGMLEESEDRGRIRLSPLSVAGLSVLLGANADDFADGRPREGISREQRDAVSTLPA